MSTYCGKAGERGYADGVGDKARFLFPRGLCMDSSKNLILCDGGNHCVRRCVVVGVGVGVNVCVCVGGCGCVWVCVRAHVCCVCECVRVRASVHTHTQLKESNTLRRAAATVSAGADVF